MIRADFELFLKVLDELEGKVVIVEGKKDAEALGGLGVKNVVPINGKALITLVPKLKGKEAVILTDFDYYGRKTAAQLIRLLQKHRIKSSSRLRKMFKMFGKTRIEDFGKISNLASFMGLGNLKRGEYHGKISANFNKIHNKSSDQGEGCCRKA